MRLLFNLVLLILAAAPPALAQAPEPPSRVGQISYVSGNLAFRAAGDTQWSAAGVNYPVATGGSFSTDPQARAQIQIGPTTIGMAGGTELDVTNLNDQVSQFSLPQGRINLHLRQLDNGQSFEVDLPQGAVWLLQPGSYDIDAATADQPARVAVFAGSARFVGGGADIGVNRGDAAVLTGANPVVARIEHAAPDAFVEWCAAHDYHAEGLAAAHYVSPQMTGYADLDHYGGWQGNPQYGEVWYPSQVPADWAPYRDGRWIWVQPWGWTWVDQQPWGFAPFHYGRWAYVDDRWGWVPGSYVAQPVYAPALVAFVGAVAGIGLAAGGGPAVGWFPLAPGETYWPSYTHNVYYIRNVNITNVKNINNIVVQSNGAPPSQVANANFANRRFATVVPQRVFANADPVAPAAIHVSPAMLRRRRWCSIRLRSSRRRGRPPRQHRGRSIRDRCRSALVSRRPPVRQGRFRLRRLVSRTRRGHSRSMPPRRAARARRRIRPPSRRIPARPTCPNAVRIFPKPRAPRRRSHRARSNTAFPIRLPHRTRPHSRRHTPVLSHRLPRRGRSSPHRRILPLRLAFAARPLCIRLLRRNLARRQ